MHRLHSGQQTSCHSATCEQKSTLELLQFTLQQCRSNSVNIYNTLTAQLPDSAVCDVNGRHILHW